MAGTKQAMAAVARETGAPLSYQPVTVAAPVGDEVLVRIVGTGLCHTDVAALHGQLPVALPIVLGHEGAGIVEAVGPGVVALGPGDAVVLTFLSCGACASCTHDQPAYCASFGPLNFAGQGGAPDAVRDAAGPIASGFFGQSSFATHALASERNAIRVATDAPLGLLGPLGCGLQTGAGAVLRALDVPAGSSILILGGGPVGLAAVMAAATRGCAAIILSEPFAARRALALEIGATHVIDPGATADLAGAVRAILPDGVAFALDTTARLEVIAATVAALARRGTLGLVGVPADPRAALPLSLLDVTGRGLAVRGICEGDSDPASFIPELVDLFLAGRFPLDRLVSAYPMADINQAIDDQAAGRCVKAVLVP